MRYTLTLLLIFTLTACTDTERPQPPWDVEPLKLVVSTAWVEKVCTEAGKRACYKNGAAYVRSDDPNLPEGTYFLHIPIDWQPPPWPRPTDRLGIGQEMEAGRKLFEHLPNKEKYGIDSNKLFNRAADIAHEATHHLGFDH